MAWQIEFCDEFAQEYAGLAEPVQDELLAHLKLLERFGPALGRPQVDTLKGSKYSNMKELRFQADHGVWRVAFAFDPHRKGIVLVAGDKSGSSEKLFYRTLIRKADSRFDGHLILLKEGAMRWRSR